MSLETAWTEATEYLAENDWPALVEDIRQFGLAVLEEAFSLGRPYLTSGSESPSWRALREQIEELGK